LILSSEKQNCQQFANSLIHISKLTSLHELTMLNIYHLSNHILNTIVQSCIELQCLTVHTLTPLIPQIPIKSKLKSISFLGVPNVRYEHMFQFIGFSSLKLLECTCILTLMNPSIFPPLTGSFDHLVYLNLDCFTTDNNDVIEHYFTYLPMFPVLTTLCIGYTLVQ
jgi:hypothetical protein